MSRNHSGVGQVKKWKARIYCLHGDCTSNTHDPVPNVFMIPFAKPCSDLLGSIVDPERTPHNPKQCKQCSKVLKWIDLCKRADRNITIFDISRKSYICSKHFHHPLGPTNDRPDPYPADKSEMEVAKTLLAIEKPLASRASIKKEKNNAAADVDPLYIGLDDLYTPESTANNFEHVEVKMESVETDQYQLFDGLGKILFKHNFAIKNNSGAIQVTIHKGVCVDIQPTLDIDINVHGTLISNDHEMWATVTKKLSANSNEESIITYFHALQQWSVCSAFERARIVSRFQTEFRETLSDFDKAKTALNLVSTCRVLSPTVTCCNCKRRTAALQTKPARKATRKDQQSLSTTNLKCMAGEKTDQRIQYLQHELILERREVERLRMLLLHKADGAKVAEPAREVGVCRFENDEVIFKSELG